MNQGRGGYGGSGEAVDGLPSDVRREMSFWAGSMLLVAGIAVHAAASHGLLGFFARPRDRARLALAATSAAVAMGAVSVAALNSAASSEEHVLIGKWLFFPASMAWTAGVVWFVAFFTRVRLPRFLFALSAALGAVLLLNLWLPTGLLHSGFGELEKVRILGSTITIGSADGPHRLMPIHDIVMAGALAYVVYAVYRARRRDGLGEPSYLLLLVPLLAITMMAHVLNGRAMLIGHYLTELGFFAAVLATSLAVQRNSVRTEANLQEYRTKLEAMVEDRVEELGEVNRDLSREIIEHRSAEDSLRRRMAELDALQKISHDLTVTGDVREGLLVAGGHIRRLFDAQHVQIDLLTPGADGESRLEWDDAVVVSEETFLPAGLALRAIPAFRALVEQRKSIVVEDFDFQPAVSMGESELRSDGSENPAIGCLLLLPMLGKDGLVGVLGIGRSTDNPLFDSAERRLAGTVTERLAVAVENDRLHALEERRAAAAERDRLARDLHDAVTQSVYSASLIAEALPAVFERSRAEGLKNLERLRLLVRGALAEMRTLLCELRPSALEAADLDTLLQRLAEVLSGQAQIPVTVEVDEDIEVPEEVKIALYRVVQEAFSNVSKHARATRASVRVSANGSDVELSVYDDGGGFEPGGASSEHMGLRIMQERMEAVGARLEIASEPSRGTSLHVLWPRTESISLADRR